MHEGYIALYDERRLRAKGSSQRPPVQNSEQALQEPGETTNHHSQLIHFHVIKSHNQMDQVNSQYQLECRRPVTMTASSESVEGELQSAKLGDQIALKASPNPTLKKWARPRPREAGTPYHSEGTKGPLRDRESHRGAANRAAQGSGCPERQKQRMSITVVRSTVRRRPEEGLYSM
jgi:hypothetical protein